MVNRIIFTYQHLFYLMSKDWRQTVNKFFFPIRLETVFPMHYSGKENILVPSVIRHLIAAIAISMITALAEPTAI